MAKDFKANQIRTSKIIGSGSSAGNPGLLIYSASDATNISGGIPTKMLDDVGSDVFLFVSGAKDDRSGVALFGGDVVVSGTLYMEKLVAEVDLTHTGSAMVSGSLIVSSSATVGGGLIVNDADDNRDSSAFTVFGDNKAKTLVHADPSNTTVYFLSGGASTHKDKITNPDTAFLVSGSRFSQGTDRRGTAVFGGDTVVSGAFTVFDSDTKNAPSLHVGTMNGGTGDPMVGIGTQNPQSVLHIATTYYEGIRLEHSADNKAIFTVDSAGKLELRTTESDSDNDAHIELDAEGDVILDAATGKIHFKDSGVDGLVFLSGTEGFAVYPSHQDLVFQDNAGASIFRVDTSQNTLSLETNKKVTFDGSTSHTEAIYGDGTNLHLESSTAVMILSGGAGTSADPSDAVDTNLFVSGAIGSKGTATRGTSVFGGDLHVSGNFSLGGGTALVKGTGDVNRIAFWSATDTITGDADLEYDSGNARLTNAGSFNTGFGTRADGDFSMAQGQFTTASANYSHTEGQGTVATSHASHAEGYFTRAIQTHAHSEGYITTGSGIASHAEGRQTTAQGHYSHAEGQQTKTTGANAHSEGFGTLASNSYAHAEGYLSTGSGQYSHAEGFESVASGPGAHAEGRRTSAEGSQSHAEGIRTITSTSGHYSHAEGYETTTTAQAAHSEGFRTTGSGDYSHAEGNVTRAQGVAAHSEGSNSWAFGDYSHAEGYFVTASGNYSHAQGQRTTSKGEASFAGGLYTVASGAHQTVVGRYNQHHNEDSYFVVGAGTGEAGDLRKDNFIVNSQNVMVGSGSVADEVFFFVSGTQTPTNETAVALFGGSLFASGNINVVQQFPATGSHLSLRNLTDTPGEGGSTKLELRAGQASSDSHFIFQKYGPNNPMLSGGPHANVFMARSGAMVFMNGNPEDSSVLGNQPFVMRDMMGGTFFFQTTGSVATSNASIHFLSGGAGTSEDLSSSDTNFIVSGSIGSAGTTVKGTSLFGGDLVVSGNIHAKQGITGSITKVNDGTSYLIAGDNVVITSASNGSITIGATGGGGGSTTTVSGSTSVGSVTSIDFTRLGLLSNLGGGAIALTGTIGLSEDGTYEDGLFTTFNANTEIGHAIDKINEVLFFLSPSPAPNLSKIGNDGTRGVTGDTAVTLGIGATNVGASSYSTVTAAGGIGAADVNDSFQVTTGSGNIRMGVFTSLPIITGHLADGIAQNAYVNGVINHSGSAFGDADQGSLKLEINGSVRHTVDLTDQNVGDGDPGFGTDSQVDGNSNGFFNLSTTGSAVQANGQPFGLFKYRTGKVRVGTNFQNKGYNYARVIHEVGGVDRTTNFLEWFADTDGVNPSANNTKIEEVVLSGSKFISGICFATGAQGKYKSRIDNFYDHVYLENPISFTTSNTENVANQNIPQVGTSANSYLDVIPLTASFQVSEASINAGTMASGSVTFNYSVVHPTKNDLTNAGPLASKEFLLYSASQFATVRFEDFVYEDFRLMSASYTTQASLTDSGHVWFPQLHLTSSEVGHGDGLAFFAGKLKAPAATTANGGNFRIFEAGFALTGSGIEQPDYSGITSGQRTFYRAFRNESGGSANNFKLTITGSSTTVVSADTSLDTGKIRVFVKNPEKTGWMDAAAAFQHGQGSTGFLVRDNDGANIGTFTAALAGSAVSNNFSFGTGSVGNGDRIAVRVEADATWSGEIDGMDVVFPAVGSVSDAPTLDELDVTSPSSFASGKLSFGTSKPLTGYQIVTGSSSEGNNSGESYGFGTSVDFNEDYVANVSVGSNKRYGIVSSNGSVQTFSGPLNGDVSANGNNYPADTFRNAHTGTLELYVNQSGSNVVPIHSLDLATFAGSGNPGTGAGSSLNGNGSGFTGVSIAAPGEDASGLPDFNFFHRTANFQVNGADQNSKGWNWARVIHKVEGQPDEITTFVEWVNDDDGNAVDIPAFETGPFGAESYYLQSGVRYFDTALTTVATGSASFRVSDAYTNVYDNSDEALRLVSLTHVDAIGIFASGSSVTDKGDISGDGSGTSLPVPTVGGDITDDIHVTGTLKYTGGSSLPGDAAPLNIFTARTASARLNVSHPIDTTAFQTVTFQNFLAYSGSSDTSDINTTEKFTAEFFRLQSGSFDNQDASGSLKWDSGQSLVGSDDGHNTGLLIYGRSGAHGYLVSPKSTSLPNAGDFRNAGDLNSPPENVDYTSASGERHFFRAFKNNTTSDQAVISLVLKGDATLVPRTGAGSASLGANKNIYAFVKIPGKTGWLDVGKPADGTITDGGGALQGDRDATVDSSGATNEVTFSTAFVGGDVNSDGSGEYFCLAIHADSNWTGYIEEILITF